MVGVQHLTRVDRVEDLVGALVPRDARQPVEVRADHLRLAGLLARPLQALELALGLLADGVGHARLVDLGPVVLADRGVVLAQLTADGLHLLAQEVLALLLLGAGLDVLADPLADLQLGQPLALEVQGLLQPLGDVELLEELHLLLEGEVGGVARRVGQCARLHDGTQERRDALVGAAQLEDLLDHGAVLTLERPGTAVHGRVVGTLLGGDPQAAEGIGARRAEHSARLALQHGPAATAGDPHGLDDAGDRADLGVLALVARHEQHALLTVHVDRQRDVHGREDDRVVERDEKKIGHVRRSFPLR